MWLFELLMINFSLEINLIPQLYKFIDCFDLGIVIVVTWRPMLEANGSDSNSHIECLTVDHSYFKLSINHAVSNDVLIFDSVYFVDLSLNPFVGDSRFQLGRRTV